MRAAGKTDLPVVISFTVETDGRLPSGQALGDAIEQVDAETDGATAYFMVNCAHPTHLAPALDPAPWLDRVRGLRANASPKSHAELDEAEELDEGDPAELAAGYSGSAAETAESERRRRVLRHRPPPRRRDQRRLHSVTTNSNEAQASSAKIAS